MNKHVIAIFIKDIPMLATFFDILHSLDILSCRDDICFGNQKNNALSYRLNNVGLPTKAYAFFFMCYLCVFIPR